MNRLITVIFCVGLAVAVMGAEPEYCDTPDGKVEVGKEFYTENPCMRNTCNAGGSVMGVGCPTSPLRPGCKIVTGKGKWPACCEKHVCPSDSS